MNPTPAVIHEVVSALERLDIPFVVGGSFASSAWGNPRQTNDLDLVLLLDEQSGLKLAEALKNSFSITEPAVLDALQATDEFRSFSFIHYEEIFKVDCFVAYDSEYTRAQLARARPIDLGGVVVPVASPEDTIIAKLRWYQLGNRVSDRQWNDIQNVLSVQEGLLDVEYMRRWCRHFGVEALFEEAIAESQDL